MSKILVLGAGFVAGPLVDYLSNKNHSITVASQFLAEAQTIKNSYPAISISQLNVTDNDALGRLVSAHDLTISFVPYQFHLNVAEQCINYSKHMVTASYQCKKMKTLHQRALSKKITILNEIGLDPGIDHLGAMQIIDRIHQQGGKIESFVSWCGGLPAPSFNDNPLGYKFAWSPKSVLMALLNEATYLKDGKILTISADKLLEHVQSVELSKTMILEGYPNRDSISYRDIYGITEAKEVFRGTLRNPGFSAILHCCKALGLLDTEQDLQLAAPTSWPILIKQRIEDLDHFLEEQSALVIHALKWLGLFDHQQMVAESTSMIDAFCSLLMDKLSYAKNETDRVILQHTIRSVTVDGTAELRQSTLILDGNVGGYSAMAKTVGTPAAIAADLIVTGIISDRGVILPINSTTYNPILERLKEQGICFVETLETGNDV